MNHKNNQTRVLIAFFTLIAFSMPSQVKAAFEAGGGDRGTFATSDPAARDTEYSVRMIAKRTRIDQTVTKVKPSVWERVKNKIHDWTHDAPQNGDAFIKENFTDPVDKKKINISKQQDAAADKKLKSAHKDTIQDIPGDYLHSASMRQLSIMADRLSTDQITAVFNEGFIERAQKDPASAHQLLKKLSKEQIQSISTEALKKLDKKGLLNIIKDKLSDTQSNSLQFAAKGSRGATGAGSSAPAAAAEGSRYL